MSQIGVSTTSPESCWPGERDPSCHDVQAANERPEPAFLSEYKKALLSSPDAKENEDLMHLDLEFNSRQKFTYPAALLSDFPGMPAPNELFQLREVFSKRCAGHVFLGRLPLPHPSHEPVAPPLRLAIACLASVHAGHAEAEARDLFLAGYSLWSVMLEVDNREARSRDMLMAAILLTLYGPLTADERIWRKSAFLVCSSTTIARRMRCHDPVQLENLLGPRASTYSAALIWCLWLADILHALHSDLSLTIFSSRELCTRMPSSACEFQDVYRRLLAEDSTGYILPAEKAPNDDAVLLLMAILSDLLCLRRSLGHVVSNVDSANGYGCRHNPFVPFSPHTELDRMQDLLSSALDWWHATFHALLPPEIMAFYHYCRLHLSCSNLLDLPQMAGYRPLSPLTIAKNEVSISEESLHQAWLVLDSAAARAKLPSSETLCAIWLPIVVFHASLVVWAKHSLSSTQERDGYCSAKILLAFKMEIEQMPWPCSIEMAATLNRLMSHPAPGGG